VGNEDIDIRRNKLCYEMRESTIDPFRPAKLNTNVRTLNVAEFISLLGGAAGEWPLPNIAQERRCASQQKLRADVADGSGAPN
jgi:hypothetical protein